VLVVKDIELVDRLFFDRDGVWSTRRFCSRVDLANDDKVANF